MNRDERLAHAHQWAASVLGRELPEPVPVSGDASFRRYLRVEDGPRTLILMDAPPDKEDCLPFVTLARAWRQAGIPVPDIIDWQADEGFMLLEDFGDTTFARQVGTTTPDGAAAEAATPLYEQALEALLRIQVQPAPEACPLPRFDDTLLADEYALFTDWLMRRKLGVTLQGKAGAQLKAQLTRVSEVFRGQAQVTVHRDYHSRNLMVRPMGIGILDFQDAVTGPVTYDLVSLLRDCYIQWPDDWAHHLADGFYDALPRAHRAPSRETFHRDLDYTGIQRHLKAAGIFARLALRDGKTAYLNDIPRTLGHLVRIGERHSELTPLVNLVRSDVLPGIEAELAA
ncbi:MAG: aminoglycoside phosphotransferase [Gammaproteobacteria bacterium]|nr:MAG: aminoglycoside phosphotransferase [Gammaproteobacteria bacterium]